MIIYVYAVVYQYRDIDGDLVDGGISRLYTTLEAARKYAKEKERYAYVKKIKVYEEEK